MTLYSLLGTKSRRAFCRLFKPRFCKKRAKLMKRFYLYKPRGDVVARLSKLTGLTPTQVLNQLKKERIDYLRATYPNVMFKDWEVI